MIKQATPEHILEAAALLQAGELVAFPTETVFGLGGDATNDDAMAQLFAVKQRPSDKALSVMVHDLQQAQSLAQFDERAMTLARTLWPGPISLVLPQQPHNGISRLATAGLKTISLRLPKHPVALALLRAAGCPVAAPSANLSGTLSTVTALEAAHHLEGQIGLILADAAPVIGIESTLLDLTQNPAVILRQGAVTREAIEALIGAVVDAAPNNEHLLLETPLRLNAVDVRAGEALLAFGKVNFIGAEGIGFAHDMPEHLFRNLSPDGDLDQAAAHLYTMLQELDVAKAAAIAVMKIPDQGMGKVINARLSRIKIN